MVGDGFKVDGVLQLPDHQGLARAGAAADDKGIGFAADAFALSHQKMAEGFVAAFEARQGDACLFQPCLGDLRTLSAAETVEPGVGVGPDEIGPGLYALVFVGSDQLLAQRDGRRVARLFVADADQPPLFVGHERQVDCAGKGAFFIFHRRPYVDERTVFEHDTAEIVGQGKVLALDRLQLVDRADRKVGRLRRHRSDFHRARPSCRCF